MFTIFYEGIFQRNLIDKPISFTKATTWNDTEVGLAIIDELNFQELFDYVEIKDVNTIKKEKKIK